MSPRKLLIFTSIISIFMFATPVASQMLGTYNHRSYRCQQCRRNVENCWKNQEVMGGNIKTACESGKCASLQDRCDRYCSRLRLNTSTRTYGTRSTIRNMYNMGVELR